MKITLKEIHVFCSVVKCKTMQLAANELNITQSAASQALSKLETTLGVHLFDRCARQLVLNENGRLLFPYAISLLNRNEEIELLFEQKNIEIKIGASTTIGNYLMPEYLAKFKVAYPNAKVNLSIGNTENIIDQILNFSVDMGFIEGDITHQDLITTDWLTDEMVFFVHKGASEGITTHEQLKNNPWLLREKGSGTRHIVEEYLTKHLVNFHVDMELGNSEAIKYAVAAGIGMSCLSRYVIDDLLKRDCVELINPTLFPSFTRKFYLVTHKNRQRTYGMRCFLEQLNL